MGAQDPVISAMTNFPVSYDATNYSVRTRFYAKRATEVFTTFENVFSDNTRLKRILGGQNKYPTIITHMLSDSNVVEHTDAVAIAPYFHGCWSGASGVCSNTSAVPNTLSEANSVDDIFAVMDLPYDLGRLDHERGDPDSLDGTIKLLAAQKAALDLITTRTIDLYAYEGGQHLTIRDGVFPATLQENMYHANRDPRMKDRYVTLLNGWKDAGGKLFALFTAPQTFNDFGSFGIKESLNATRADSPKYDGVLSFQEALNGCWDGYVEDGC
jgi:hypothetical protein